MAGRARRRGPRTVRLRADHGRPVEPHLSRHRPVGCRVRAPAAADGQRARVGPRHGPRAQDHLRGGPYRRPRPAHDGCVHRRRRQRRALLRDELRRWRRARQRRAGSIHEYRAATPRGRAPDRRVGRSPRGRRRRGGSGRPRQTRRVRRATGASLDHAVGEVEDARAPGDRRSRPASRGRSADAARGVHRSRRLPIRQLPGRHRSRTGHGGAGLGVVHARGSAGRCRLPRRLLVGPGRGTGATQRPHRDRGLPDLCRTARAVRPAHRAGSLEHRLLRGVLVVAARRDLGGRVRPVPARSDG